MITFLPYSDFLKSAQSLDKKRAWKQTVEAKQIINVLEGKTTAWQNHPAVKMWIGHLDALKCYYNIFLRECLKTHHINTKLDYLPFNLNPETQRFPWWISNEDFHRAMRARLIEKDKVFYLPKFPEDEGFNSGKYFWPVMETKTFRII